MGRRSIDLWAFSLVVVRLGHRFLLVQERKHGETWYFPAGRLEAGETFPAAAIRETREEAGIDIAIDGILRVEHTPNGTSARMRVIFVASPKDDTPPKSLPDDESLRAAWVTLDELDDLRLRGQEVREVLTAVAAGAPVYPLSLLAPEGER